MANTTNVAEAVLDYSSVLGASAGVGGVAGAVIIILYKLFTTFNGKKFVSDCCGRKGELGFTLTNMTPPAEPPKV